jgi:hypothetical protein
MECLFFKPHELAARNRKEKTGNYLLYINRFSELFKIHLKMQFRFAPVFFFGQQPVKLRPNKNDLLATLPARALRGRRVKQHPILKKDHPSCRVVAESED